MSIFQDNPFEQAALIEKKIAGLEKKSKASGISYSILKQVYDRGMAAWKTGHRPGASQQQWAFARVNSFISKGSGTWGKADKDLAAKVKKEAVNESEIGDKLRASDTGDSVDTDIIRQDPMKFHNPRFGKPIVAHCYDEDEGHFDFIFYSDGVSGLAIPGHRQEDPGRYPSPDEEAFMFDHKPSYNDFKREAMAVAKDTFNDPPMKVLKFDSKIRDFKNRDGESQFNVRRMPKTTFREDVEEDKNMKDDGNYMKGVKQSKKDDREDQFKKQAKMDDDDPDAYKPAPGDKDADGNLKKTKVSKHTKKYHQMYGDKEESTMSIFTGQKNIFAEAKIKFRNERDVEKHKQNLLMAMEIAVEADGDYTGATKQIEKLERGLSKNPSVMAALKFYAEDVAFPEEIQKELEEKGLWANIHAKRKRGERMRKKGEKGAPTQDALKKAQGEDISEGSRFLKYSDLMKQKADMIGKFGKAAFMKPEMKKIDRLIKKELTKLGMDEEMQEMEGTSLVNEVVRDNSYVDDYMGRRQMELSKYLRKKVRNPKIKDKNAIYFDGTDLVANDKTVISGALANPDLKVKDLLDALKKFRG